MVSKLLRFSSISVCKFEGWRKKCNFGCRHLGVCDALSSNFIWLNILRNPLAVPICYLDFLPDRAIPNWEVLSCKGYFYKHNVKKSYTKAICFLAYKRGFDNLTIVQAIVQRAFLEFWKLVSLSWRNPFLVSCRLQFEQFYILLRSITLFSCPFMHFIALDLTVADRIFCYLHLITCVNDVWIRYMYTVT